MAEARVSVGTFLPTIIEFTAALSDGKLTVEEQVHLVDVVADLAKKLIVLRPAAPPVTVQPAASSAFPFVSGLQPAPQSTPAPPATAGGSMLKIVRLKVRLTGIFDRNNNPVEPDPLPGVLRGDNWDNGFNGHSDCTPVLEDGSELSTGDPRWQQVNRWAPNGNAIFPYYEYDGQLTDIRHGDHGNPNVDPTSFEDDEGCTVTWKVDTPAPHNTQHKFRFGYMHKNADGSFVDSGLIGQGNVSGGEPFNIR